jgi:hypothetical protein
MEIIEKFSKTSRFKVDHFSKIVNFDKYVWLVAYSKFGTHYIDTEQFFINLSHSIKISYFIAIKNLRSTGKKLEMKPQLI